MKVKNRPGHFAWFVLLGFGPAFLSPASRAAETLQSTALRLELNTAPYSYCVIERSTGEVLVSETGGYIRFPEKELFARWLEFSAFSPMMEVLNGPKRTIWDDYDDELVQIATTYAAEHHDLIPYTRSSLYQSTKTGMPVTRALVFACPGDHSGSPEPQSLFAGRQMDGLQR